MSKCSSVSFWPSPRRLTFTWWGCYGLCLWRLSIFSLCSTSFISSFNYMSLYESLLSPHIIPSDLLGSKHQLTNFLTKAARLFLQDLKQRQYRLSNKKQRPWPVYMDLTLTHTDGRWTDVSNRMRLVKSTHKRVNRADKSNVTPVLCLFWDFKGQCP